MVGSDGVLGGRTARSADPGDVSQSALTVIRILELIAALAGVVSVYLSARQNIWNWPTAIVNVVLYAIVFQSTGLYSDMALQFVVLVLTSSAMLCRLAGVPIAPRT